MSGCSMGEYSGGTAFVGLGAFRPTALTPFQFAAFVDPLGEITLQQASISTAVIGTGIYFAHYAGLFGNIAVSQKITMPAVAQVQNITVADAQVAVGVHWMDFPAGYFPAKVDAHTDDGDTCVLQSAFEFGYCIAEKPAVKWLKYPAGYFPQNVPAHIDDGTVSELESVFQPELVFCGLDDAPAPPKWFELYSEFVPSKMDPLVDDEVPFGYTANLVCPVYSEKAERAFERVRNPPTPVKLTPTTVQPTLDTATEFTQLLSIAIATILCTTLGVVFFVIQARMIRIEEIQQSAEIHKMDDAEEPVQDTPEACEEQSFEDQREPEEIAFVIDIDNPVEEIFPPLIEAEEVNLPGLDEVVRDLAEEFDDLNEDPSDQESVLEVFDGEETRFEEVISVPDSEITTDVTNRSPTEAEQLAIPALEDVLKHIQAVEERYWSGEFGEVPENKAPEDDAFEEVLETNVPEELSGHRRRRRRRRNPANDTQATDNLADGSNSATAAVASTSTSKALPEDNSEPGEVKKRRNRGSNRKRPARGAAASNRDV